jgi:hypothetical protein
MPRGSAMRANRLRSAMGAPPRVRTPAKASGLSFRALVLPETVVMC